MKRLLALIVSAGVTAAPLAAAAATAVFNFETGTFDSVSNPAEQPTPVNQQGSALDLPLGVIEQVSVTMLPSVPKPLDAVSIRVDSYSTDLNKASITWTRNGETFASGVGVVSVQLRAPEAGERAAIEMVAQKAEGGVVTKRISIAPADLDIIYEPQTYTPAFYPGRARFTNSSRVRLVATSNFIDPETGVKIPAEDLVYTWRVGGVVDQDISGYGRYAVDVYGKLVSRGLDVEVEAEAIRSALKARATLSIQGEQPDIAIYEDHPIYGVLFNHAVDSPGSGYPVASTEVTLLAVPYSMDIRGLADSRIKYTWLTDGGFGPTSPTVTFKPEAGTYGDAQASVRVNHSNFAQYANRAVTLVFGENSLLPTVASTTASGSYTL